MPGSKKNALLFLLVLIIMACQHPAAEPETAVEEPRTPATTSFVEFGAIHDSIELNATSSFLQSNYVKATATGYIRTVNAKPGEYVSNGRTIFSIETKESTVIGQSISTLDSSFKFNGVSNIKATGSGFVTQLDHQQGDYVQDGDQLAVISDMSSFVFLLNLPYELRPAVLTQNNVDLVLPDGVRLKGTIGQVMPTVDSLTQTQTVIIRVSSRAPLPQNLIARVRIAKTNRASAQSLPRSAVLSDEAQTNFWVMKLIDSMTAVKTEIKKGIEWNNRIEILEPQFSKTDQILTSGNYGLPDTAKVRIEKPKP